MRFRPSLGSLRVEVLGKFEFFDAVEKRLKMLKKINLTWSVFIE